MMLGIILAVSAMSPLAGQPQLPPPPPLTPPIPPVGSARPPFHLSAATDDWGTLATTGPNGLAPATVRHFYGFDLISNTGAGQIIGIVTAYDDPNAEADLATFNSTFRLTSCTTSNGCFKKIYAGGVAPPVDQTWALEASVDVQWAHAIAPSAKIYLIEARSNSVADLLSAVDVAVNNGAAIVSMSFGGLEYATEVNNDYHFNKSLVTFIAAAGDSGYGVSYPAASSYVLAVGGTTAVLARNNTYGSETAWSGSGGGRSQYELLPSYQSGLPVPYATGYRAVPDVAYDANPSSGVSVYDSVGYGGSTGWFTVGGTSAGAPQWAALAAIVNSMRVAVTKKVMGATYASTLNYLLYLLGAPSNYANNYQDITSGTNGSCGVLCTAASGYDYVTGLGTPNADALINSLVAQP